MMRVLAPLLFLVPTVALLSATTDPASSAALGAVVLGVALLVVGIGAVLAAAAIEVAPTTGPSSEERCLHGRFRRQSNPHTPGRPRPRAPGLGLLPV